MQMWVSRLNKPTVKPDECRAETRRAAIGVARWGLSTAPPWLRAALPRSTSQCHWGAATPFSAAARAICYRVETKQR